MKSINSDFTEETIRVVIIAKSDAIGAKLIPKDTKNPVIEVL